MSVGVCLRIVLVIACNVGKQWVLMQKPQDRAESTYCIVFVPTSSNCISCIDQVKVSMAMHEQVISAEQTREGLLCRGLTRLLSEVAVHMGKERVIITSAKQQAVWPICFLLGGKGKQWGGVLHTVGD